MKVSDVLSIIAQVAGAFLPGAQSIETLIEALRNHHLSSVQNLGMYTAELAASEPSDPVTVEEVEAALALLNPPLQPDPPEEP